MHDGLRMGEGDVIHPQGLPSNKGGEVPRDNRHGNLPDGRTKPVVRACRLALHTTGTHLWCPTGLSVGIGCVQTSDLLGIVSEQTETPEQGRGSFVIE